MREGTLLHWAELEHRTSKLTSIMIYFLQQGHTYFNNKQRAKPIQATTLTILLITELNKYNLNLF